MQKPMLNEYNLWFKSRAGFRPVLVRAFNQLKDCMMPKSTQLPLLVLYLWNIGHMAIKKHPWRCQTLKMCNNIFWYLEGNITLSGTFLNRCYFSTLDSLLGPKPCLVRKSFFNSVEKKNFLYRNENDQNIFFISLNSYKNILIKYSVHFSFFSTSLLFFIFDPI